MTRIATLAQHNLMQSQIAQTQGKIQELQIQTSSGQKAQRYSGIASDSLRLLNLENDRARIDQYVNGNGTVNLRLQAMETSVSETFDLATQLKTLLVNAISGDNASILSLNATATDMMNEAERDLNVKIGDRYLFSGTATGTAPVDISDPAFTAPPTSYPSNADTSYYQGNGTRLTTRVADNFDLTWGVTADEPGFEQLMRALHLVATSDNSSAPDTNRLQEALNVVNQAIANIPTIRSRIGSAQKSIDQVNTSHQDSKLYMDQTISDIKGVDIPLAVTQLTNDQNILEASYMTVSRLSSLTLANFLK